MSGVIAAFGLSAWFAVLGADAGVSSGTHPARPPARSLQAPPPLLAPVKGGPSAPADRTYELRPAGDGTGDLVYEAPTFTARVARDGRATFQDHLFRFSPRWSLFPFAPIAAPSGRPSLQSTVRDLLSRRGHRPPPEPPPARPRPRR